MRWVILALAVLFTALIGWALSTGDFFAEGRQLFEMAWGMVTLADLYLGFFLFAILIFWVEENPLTAAAVSLLLMILGNGVTALWMVIRFQVIKDKLRREIRS